MKGLEALEHIAKDDFNMLITTYPPKKAFNGITEGDMVEIIEKELKAFEIVKEQKMLSVFKNINGTCFLVFNATGMEITKEQYDLLKEVLK